jgi:putative membrane protein
MKKSVSTKKKIIRAAVIIGVIIIPLMYSFFYLSAFWDPYKKLNQLPIALVNNDKGATINSENRNLGKDFVEELEKDGSFKYIITDSEDATKGTEASDYYAMIVIPENFSNDIASASETKKQTASIIFSANEKRNYLASQILSSAEIEMETSLREQISEEIVGNLTDQVAKVPDQLGTLNDGLIQLSDGSSKLLNGTQTLADGTQTLDSGSQELKAGSETLVAGTQTLADGSQALVAGTDNLAAGTSEFASKFSAFNAGMGTLESGSEQVNAGAEGLVAGTDQLNQGIQAYTAGVDTLIDNVNQTSSFIGGFVQEHPELMADPTFAAFIQNMSSSDNAASIAQLEAAGTQISSASDSIAAGTQVLAQGTGNLDEGIAMVSVASGQLNSAADSISSGAADVANGATSLKSGAATLSNGATTLNNGVSSLASGTSSLVDGATTLVDGQQELNSGIDTAQDSVKTAVNDANADSAKLNGLSDFVSAPVTIENNNIDLIPNYGTYFTPYFLSLSLWVGALIIFFGIYFDADGKFEILSRDSTQKIKRSFIYLLIGFGQAIALGVVIRSGLGLEVNNVAFYFISICLVSLVSIAIVQFCIVHMGDFGKLAAIALLILQLTSCGGTFPMETLPKFFNVLYPFMPMTYAVVVFKESISGTITGVFWYNFMILGIYLVVFFGGTVILSTVKKRKKQKLEQSKIDFTPKEQY